MANIEELRQESAEFRSQFETLRAEVAKVIVGNTEIVEGTLTALIAGGMCCSKACRGWARPCSSARWPTRST